MPNVLFVLSDEHNPFFSSIGGNPIIETPNMEKLANAGTVFQNAYCPSPLCLPSRSAFMSGKPVHEIQTYNNCNQNLDTQHLSYGHALAAQGVHTTHIGKVDAYDRGENLGFSEMILPGDRCPPGDKNIRRNPLSIREGAWKRADKFGPHDDPWNADLMKIDSALDWLRGTATELDRSWVLSVNLVKPHFPHYTTQSLWDKYADGGDLPEYGPECQSANHPYALDLRKHFETDYFTPDQTRGLRRGYLGCVNFIDDQLGRLIAALKQTGQLEDTDIIYTSDHGEMLGKFGMWWKCSLYEDSSRVPCIASGPTFCSGNTVRTPVDLHDVRSSIFHSVGARQPEDWLGEPLQGIAKNDPERIVFSEYHGHGTRASSYMVRRGKWKYIHCCAGPDQLFNLENDPNELNNLYDVQTTVVEELEKELQKICDPELENHRAEEFIEAQLASMEE